MQKQTLIAICSDLPRPLTDDFEITIGYSNARNGEPDNAKSPTLADLRDGAIAMKSLRSSRSGAESVGRWLESIGVTRVYLRPDKDRRDDWLSEGKWQKLSVGDFVSMLERCLHPKPPEKVEESEAA